MSQFIGEWKIVEAPDSRSRSRIIVAVVLEGPGLANDISLHVCAGNGTATERRKAAQKIVDILSTFTIAAPSSEQ